jgi:hypothetical protein
LHLIPRGLIESTRSRDGGESGSFGAPSGHFKIAAMSSFDAPHFGSALALAQGTMQSLFQRFQRRRLLSGDARPLGANLSR